jgi:hypothetical protein
MIAAILILSIGLSARADMSIQVLPGSDYNSNTSAMDQTLGISNYSIYNFQTTAFITQLSSINLQFSSAPAQTYTALPQLYQPANDSALGQSFASNNWAGPSADAFNNSPGNATSANASSLASTTTFNFTTGVTAIGIGLGNFQSPGSPQFPITDHLLYINGVAQSSTLEQLAGSNWTPGIFGLNGYLEVTATGGQTIESIGFGNITAPDFLVFSHLAINASVIPEPTSLLLLALGIGGASGLAWFRRGRRSPSTSS